MVLNKLAYRYSKDTLPSIIVLNKVPLGNEFLLLHRFWLIQNLYSDLITVPQGERLVLIIGHYKNLTQLENMCGVIDDTNIKLAEKPPINLIHADFWNWHDHNSMLLQDVSDVNHLFWDVCVKAPRGTHDVTPTRVYFCTRIFWRNLFCKNQTLN